VKDSARALHAPWQLRRRSNLLTPELPQHGVPRPDTKLHADTTLFVTVLEQHYQADISASWVFVKEQQACFKPYAARRLILLYIYWS